MKIIAGIGNPGEKYAETRHNIGFMVVDRLATEYGLSGWKRRFHALAAEGPAGGARLLLLKPETYVNESGRSLRAAADWCRVAPQDIMVVCDDFNLAVGRLRVRGKGGSGGHHGLESITTHLATDEYARLRLGIGGEAERCDRDFVLSRFSTEERVKVDEAIGRAVRALAVWLESGLARCQNEFNADPAATPQDRREEETA